MCVFRKRIFFYLTALIIFCGAGVFAQVVGAEEDGIDPIAVVPTPALVVESTSPENGAKEISLSDKITVTFGEPIRPGIGFGGITVKNNVNKVRARIECTDTMLVIEPEQDLLPNNTYIVEIPVYGLKNISGTGLAQPYKFSFKTIDTCAPEIKYVDPRNRKVNVPVTAEITIRFTEDIKAGPELAGITLDDGENELEYETLFNGPNLTLKPVEPLRHNTAYTIKMPAAAVSDAAGNNNENNSKFTFTTARDAQRPKVITSEPANGSKNVPVDQVITLTFNEDIEEGPEFEKILLRQGSAPVDCTVTIEGQTMVVTPGVQLDPNKKYAVSLPAGAVQDSTEKLSLSFGVRFTTVDPKPNIVSKVPSDGSTNIATDAEIKITFDEEILEGINFNDITIRTGRSSLDFTGTVSGGELILFPDGGLVPYKKYTVTVPAGAVKDSDGNGGEPCLIRFWTVETTPPEVLRTYPRDNATNTVVDRNISILFNEKIKPGGNYDDITLEKGGIEVAIVKGTDRSVLTIAPEGGFEYETTYTVTIPAGAVEDMVGNSSVETWEFSFTTRADQDQPVVINANPENLSSNGYVGEPIQILFNEDIFEGPYIGKLILLSGGRPIVYVADISGDILTITPEQDLDFGKEIVVKIPGNAVMDSKGNPCKPFKMSFYTVQSTNTPSVTGTDPVNGDESVDPSKEITVTFNENIKPGPGFGYMSLKEMVSSKEVAIACTVVRNSIIVTPREEMISGTQYELYIPTAAVKDEGGNPSMNFSLEFTTE